MWGSDGIQWYEECWNTRTRWASWSWLVTLKTLFPQTLPHWVSHWDYPFPHQKSFDVESQNYYFHSNQLKDNTLGTYFEGLKILLFQNYGIQWETSRVIESQPFCFSKKMCFWGGLLETLHRAAVLSRSLQLNFNNDVGFEQLLRTSLDFHHLRRLQDKTKNCKELTVCKILVHMRLCSWWTWVHQAPRHRVGDLPKSEVT